MSSRGATRGQSIVEFTLILPVILMLLMGMLEFGSAYDHRTAMAYSVREGARVGASLGNGGANPGGVDAAIIEAVRRGLTNPILIENVESILIFKSSTTGTVLSGASNTYDRDGILVGTAGWPAATRVPGLTGDSIGVRVVYRFKPTTPFGSLMASMFGSTVPYAYIKMTDQTVMKLEPAA
jgi:Flp pilus assembly protein TadG